MRVKKSVESFLDFRYEKVKLLKQSVRGEVWLACERHGDEFVIIKRVRATGLPYVKLQNSAFKLPAKTIYCAEDEVETVVVEEFLRGENLSARLKRKNFLSEAEAQKILLQLCDGLGELHAQKIIHRDIKPSNLILSGGRIRLIDYDAARTFKPGKTNDTKLLGTEGYAAPEQYGGRQTDERSDIYLLGVTMKVLLGKGYCGRLKKFLDVCMQFDPNNRFQSVGELKRAIRLKNLSDKLKGAGIFVSLVAAMFVLPPKIDSGIVPPVAEEILSHNDEFNLSLGELKLGDSVEVVQKIFGREEKVAPAETPNHRHSKYKSVVVTFAGNSVVGIVSNGNELQTERGLREGTPLDEVIAAYGRCGAVYEYDGLTLYEYPYVSAGGNLAVMRFAVKDNAVEYISLRLANEEREHILADVTDF